MTQILVLTFIELFVAVFNLLIIVRIVMSYVARPANQFYSGVVGITEPLLDPVRRLLPGTPGMDMAPLVVFFLLEGLQYLAGKFLGS
jgi:YggT family protein